MTILQGPLFNVMLGSLLGDGYLRRSSPTANTSFGEGHAVGQEDYLRWKMEFWTKAGVNVSWAYRDPSRPSHQGAITARTTVLPELNRWHDLFYGWNPSGPGRKPKRFPPEVVPLITPLGLAVWYMDDGGAGHRPTFSCHPRSVEVGCAVLAEYGLNHRHTISGVGTRGVSSRIVVLDHDRFLDIVRPHIHPTMRYKLEPTIFGQAARINDQDFRTQAQGMGLVELARHFQTGVRTIKTKAAALGLAIKDTQYVQPDMAALVLKVPRQGKQGRNVLHLPQDPLRALVANGLSVHRIGQRFGVSHGIVQRELKRHGIPYTSKGKWGGSRH